MPRIYLHTKTYLAIKLDMYINKQHDTTPLNIQNYNMHIFSILDVKAYLIFTSIGANIGIKMQIKKKKWLKLAKTRKAYCIMIIYVRKISLYSSN